MEIRESLESAFESATPTEASPVPSSPATPAEGQARDEGGRYAKQEPAGEPAEDTAPKTYARPQAWKKDYEADWGALPERVQSYITEREQQAATGIHQYKQQWDQASPIYQAVSPFLQELGQHGQDPAKWIGELGQFNRTMAFGTPEQKLQTLMNVAQAYGVALPQNGQINPQLAQMMQGMQQMQGQLRSYETQRQEAEVAAAEQSIHEFASGDKAPHFEEVREAMGQLLQAGMASGLQDAYDMAVRMNGDVWKAEQARQASEAEAQRKAALSQKKATAV